MKFNNRGETIVEVLIVTAILGSVLTGAFSIANRTLLNTRQSQERAEAVGIAQDQIERLKTVYSNSTPTASRFCLSSSSAVEPATDPLIGDPTSTVDFSKYPAGCIINNRYHTFMEYQSANKTFIVYVNWDNALGEGQDRLSTVYRVAQLSVIDTIMSYIASITRLVL